VTSHFPPRQGVDLSCQSVLRRPVSPMRDRRQRGVTTGIASTAVWDASAKPPRRFAENRLSLSSEAALTLCVCRRFDTRHGGAEAQSVAPVEHLG
jgi:hypothetical protein